MTTRSDHIEVDPFDREYGLADLLPAALAQELLADINNRCTAAIATSNGSVYYACGMLQAEVAADLKRRGHHGATAPQLFSANGRRAGTFILTHELETIGFLVLETDGERGLDDDLLLSMGGLAARCINRIINLNYRNRMTAGLHGRVVADSYESLKIKAEQLARSEEKYRLLAKNLEIEVEKKTREIRDAQLRLLQQEKMASIGQLAAGVAHEINNPVGFVISNLNTLRSGSEDLINLIGSYRQLTDLLTDRTGDDRKAERIKTRMTAIDRLIKDIDLDFVLEDTLGLIDESLDGAKRVKIIVQNLRDFTHPSVETAESVDFNSCLETTLAMLSSHAMPRVKISRNYGAIPQVTCRLREINQVFYNILKNAFQALGEQGEGDLTICTAADDEAVSVQISDTGPGIDQAHLGSIFNPFFTTREVGSGIGLGLFQTYTTVKSHGGSIDVESEFGKGTTFTVKIPIEGNDRE
jgi:two-component system, NtrC family, sensor kinase